MLEEVDFDPAAAAAAAAACENAAAALRAKADLLDASRSALASWSGGSALQFDAASEALAWELQAEAARLHATADAIGRAVTSARAADDERVADRQARQRAAEEARAVEQETATVQATGVQP